MDSLVRMVLDEAGVKQERLSLQWASAAEAPRFVKLITDFTGQVRELGPLGEAEGLEPAEIKSKLEKALAVISDRKVRMFFGNATKAVRKEANYSREYIAAVIEDKMTKTVTAAFSAPAEDKEKPAEKKAKKPAAKAAPKKAKAPAKKAEKKPAKKAAPKAKKAAKKKPAAKKAAPKKAAAKKKKSTVKKKTTAKKK